MRFGVRLNKKAETVRDRRLSRDEEKRLLDAALQQINTATHQYVGELLHDWIIGALELCCRREYGVRQSDPTCSANRPCPKQVTAPRSDRVTLPRYRSGSRPISMFF